MAREIPDCPAPPVDADPWRGYERQDLSIEVVTPMFGGGVTPGQPDPVTLVRVPSIRGHLRFWWQATRGAACRNVQELRTREAEIWGDTENPSPVIVTVSCVAPAGERTPDNAYGFGRFDPEAYALFSAKQNEAPLCREGLRFNVQMHWPGPALLQELRDRENVRRRRNRMPTLPESVEDITCDVRVSLWAWLRFGGIGGRTRRGCGALRTIRAEPRLQETGMQASGIRVFFGESCNNDALLAWRKAVGVYRDFRQSFRGRRHDKSLPNGRVLRGVLGRSHWPEPDSIRYLTGCALRRTGGPSGVPDDENTHDHTKPVVAKHLLPAFPRALLGMPIVFHFGADGPGKGKNNVAGPGNRSRDPQDVEIVPDLPWISRKGEHGKASTGTRMASPVITRPLFLDREVRRAVVFLPRPPRMNARLKGKLADCRHGAPQDLDVPVPDARLEGRELAALKPMQGRDNAIDALVVFLGQHKYTELHP